MQFVLSNYFLYFILYSMSLDIFIINISIPICKCSQPNFSVCIKLITSLSFCFNYNSIHASINVCFNAAAPFPLTISLMQNFLCMSQYQTLKKNRMLNPRIMGGYGTNQKLHANYFCFPKSICFSCFG